MPRSQLTLLPPNWERQGEWHSPMPNQSKFPWGNIFSNSLDGSSIPRPTTPIWSKTTAWANGANIWISQSQCQQQKFLVFAFWVLALMDLWFMAWILFRYGVRKWTKSGGRICWGRTLADRISAEEPQDECKDWGELEEYGRRKSKVGWWGHGPEAIDSPDSLASGDCRKQDGH